MSAKKIKICGGEVAPVARIESDDVHLTPSPKLSFGFKYFREIENFGLKSKSRRISNRWMLSLIDRLKQLSLLSKDDFDSYDHTADELRHHKIDWQAKNVPISRADFPWVNKDYPNDEEYPFWQFQLSSSMGRFFGFYDENNVFQVVCVDPLHNAQPAGGHFEYKVDSCTPLETDLVAILAYLNQVYSKCRLSHNCPYHSELGKIFSGKAVMDTPIIAFFITESKYAEYVALVKEHNKNDSPLDSSDVFYEGLKGLQAKLSDK